MKHLTLLSFALAAAVAGCAPRTGTPVEESPSASSEDAMAVEYGVSYQGVVEEAGISIYMQGSHRLTLADGGFVLLESEDVDLDAYVGKEVEVYGDARDSVEGGGTILTVTDVTVLSEPEASVASSAAVSETASSVPSSVAASSVPASRAASVARSAAPRSSVARSSVVAQASTAPAASAAPQDPMVARAEAMAKANMAPSNWTRQYCPPQRDFCFAIHKNWYYNSFGATTSYLWHVEISNEPVDSLGDGPLSVNVVSGTSAEKGGSSSDVIAKGGFVVGYFDWTDGNHFEITAPAALEPAVRHITQNIVPAPSSSASAGAASSR